MSASDPITAGLSAFGSIAEAFTSWQKNFTAREKRDTKNKIEDLKDARDKLIKAGYDPQRDAYIAVERRLQIESEYLDSLSS